MKVTGLGQCSLDYLALVKGYPIENAKEEVLDLCVQGGGPVATALVTLSRLGAKTRFVGVVSNDPVGAEIKKGLKAEGVDLAGLKTVNGGASQTAFIIVNAATAARTILWRRPTVAALSGRDVKERFIKDSRMLLLDGLMVEASLKAAAIARKYRIPVMLDAGRVRPGMIKLAAMSDYVVASKEFAQGLSSTPSMALKTLAGFGAAAATVTLGERGSVTAADGETFRTPAFKVKAVDTTGAGDVFHGAYIFGILSGWEMRRTVDFAGAVAALKCRAIGGRSGIPTLAQALAFMKRAKHLKNPRNAC